MQLPLKCPHCGSTSGVFQRIERLQYYTPDGAPNGESKHKTYQGRMLYCRKCSEPVCNISTLEKLMTKKLGQPISLYDTRS